MATAIRGGETVVGWTVFDRRGEALAFDFFIRPNIPRPLGNAYFLTLFLKPWTAH
jgi:hypothetical protein